MRKPRPGWIPLFILLVLVSANLGAKEKIPVLILSGQNNHAWEETTPVLVDFLEATGRFDITVTEAPEALTAADLEGVRVILSNWNTYPKWRGPAPEVTDWPAKAREAYAGFIKNGGGVVTLHAGASSFYDWDAYFRAGLVRWGKDVTTHGRPALFPVHLSRDHHPILEGMDDFQLRDELWVNPEVYAHPAVRPIGFSLSTKEEGGAETMEPCIFVGWNGWSRSFATTLGHDGIALAHPSLRALLARAIEWTAREDITITADSFAGEDRLHWDASATSLALTRNGQTVWRFNARPEDSKPSFHPLTAPDGEVLTGFRPLDHIWHRGAWWTWKFLDWKNFWEEDVDGVPLDGLTEVEDVRFFPREDFSARIELDVAYTLKTGERKFDETRVIEVSAPDAKGGYQITSAHSFTAASPTTITAWYYGGFSLRLAYGRRPGWMFIDESGAFDADFQSNWGREDGKNVLLSPPAAWTAFVEHPERPGQGVAILDHPDNPRHPVRWLVLRDMPFMSPVFHYGEDLKLEAGDRLDLKYRILIFADERPRSFLEAAFEQFSKDESSS